MTTNGNGSTNNFGNKRVIGNGTVFGKIVDPPRVFTSDKMTIVTYNLKETCYGKTFYNTVKVFNAPGIAQEGTSLQANGVWYEETYTPKSGPKAGQEVTKHILHTSGNTRSVSYSDEPGPIVADATNTSTQASAAPF